jgi:hypothetical protein
MTATVLDFDLIVNDLEEPAIICDLDERFGCGAEAKWIISYKLQCGCSAKDLDCNRHKEELLAEWNNFFYFPCKECGNDNHVLIPLRNVITSIEPIKNH